MSIVRLVIYFFISSILFSNSIEYKIDESKIKFIDNHFIINNSNAVIIKDDLIFDIHRLEFILDDKDKFNFKINNIEWAKTNHKIDDKHLNDLVSINNSFNYRSCPMMYIDIFPYKKDKDNNLFYIKSLNIEFDINQVKIDSFCNISDKIINKDFLFIENSSISNSRNIDYLVITNNDLLSTADILHTIHNDLNIEILDINDIISAYEGEDLENEYIIRNYLLSRISSEINLNYLLLLGDETIIPPIYNNSIPSDDFYTSPGNLTANPQLSTGRIPVNNIEDANNYMIKLDNYIQNLYNPIDYSHSWKMNISLISDDENNPNPNKYPELSHTENSNLLYEQINDNLIINTFYGIDYTPTQDSDGLLHPDLTNDLIEHINNGVSLINYIGHGNYRTLADEKLLDMERDLNLINCQNYKLPIWVVGTCSFGEYDGKDSMAEALLLKDNGGISVISTTRGIGETSNINYLTKLFNQINDYMENIDNDDRLGDFVRDAKNNSGSEYLFHLFGDPALPLPFPKINNNSLLNYPSELIVGDEANINIGPYNGYINIFDQEKNITRGYDSGDTINYNIPGSSIYKGYFYEDVCFTTSIDAATCNECASIYTYIDNSEYNFIQNIFDLNIIENENINNEDLIGPSITFNTIDNRILDNDDIVFLDDLIIVKAEDESGINLMNGLGHNIRYWFNDSQNYNFIDSDLFEYLNNCDSSPIGEFIIPISNVELGLNTLFVEVWDNFNNRTINSIELNVENSSFKAYDVYNFPNPFIDITYFTFKTSFFPINATISIFDLNGNKVNKINSVCESSFCSVYWDGTDFNSKKINNGTYIYSLKIEYNNQIFRNLYKITKLR